jgi:hypothetical protein
MIRQQNPPTKPSLPCSIKPENKPNPLNLLEFSIPTFKRLSTFTCQSLSWCHLADSASLKPMGGSSEVDVDARYAGAPSVGEGPNERVREDRERV